MIQAAGVTLPAEFSGSWAAYGVAIAFTLSIPVDVKRLDIRPADAIAWSWRQAFRRAGIAVIAWQWFLILGVLELTAIRGLDGAAKEFGVGAAGFWPGLGVGAAVGVVWVVLARMRGWLAPAVVGTLAALGAEIGLFVGNTRGSLGILFATLLFGLLVGLFGGLTSGIDPNRARRSGAWFWVKVPALAGVIVGVTVSVVITALSLPGGRENVVTGAAIGGTVGGILALVAFVRFGGLQGLQHFILRWQLVRSGALPRDMVGFLDQGVRVHLLQKVGFGYRFIHALMLDHFAANGDTQKMGPIPK